MIDTILFIVALFVGLFLGFYIGKSNKFTSSVAALKSSIESQQSQSRSELIGQISLIQGEIKPKLRSRYKY